jgi:hypothetical protein
MIKNSAAYRIMPVIFIKPETVVPGIRTEYLVEADCVKFHFWPDPKFPEEFATLVTKALRNFSEGSLEVDYVPEVDSWYLCVKNLPFRLNALFVENILKKISSAVATHE